MFWKDLEYKCAFFLPPSAKRILVINNDPEAPFFSKADYGVVGDLHEVLPAIIEEIKRTA